MSTLETHTRQAAVSAAGHILALMDKPWAPEYRKLCRQSGSFLRTAGLVAYVANLISESSQDDTAGAARALLRQLGKDWEAEGDAQAIHGKALRADAREYMRLTRRTIRFIHWHQRLAEAIIPDPDEEGGGVRGTTGQLRTVPAVVLQPLPEPRPANDTNPILLRREAIDRLLGTGVSVGDNPSLAFTKLLPAFHRANGNTETSIRDALLSQFIDTVPSQPCREAYKQAYYCYSNILKQQEERSEATVFELTTTSRLVVGGMKGALKFGLTFSQPYGTPVIPGSSLKGIAAAFAARVGGDLWKKGARDAVELFGGLYTPPEGQPQEWAGLVSFLDAWWIPSDGRGPYDPEIVNRHDGAYYEGIRGRLPDGMESPVPFGFLAIRPGVSFRFAIQGGTENDRKIAVDVLSRALANGGVGGKVRIGYGRLRN